MQHTRKNKQHEGSELWLFSYPNSNYCNSKSIHLGHWITASSLFETFFHFQWRKKSYGILMFLTHIRAYVCAQLDLFLISLFLLLMLPKVRMTSWSRDMMQQSNDAHNDPSFLHYALQSFLFAILNQYTLVRQTLHPTLCAFLLRI